MLSIGSRSTTWLRLRAPASRHSMPSKRPACSRQSSSWPSASGFSWAPRVSPPFYSSFGRRGSSREPKISAPRPARRWSTPGDAERLGAQRKVDVRFRYLGGLHHHDAAGVGGLVLRGLCGDHELVLARLDVRARPGLARRALLVLDDDIAPGPLQGRREAEVLRLVGVLDRCLDCSKLRGGPSGLLAFVDLRFERVELGLDVLFELSEVGLKLGDPILRLLRDDSFDRQAKILPFLDQRADFLCAGFRLRPCGEGDPVHAELFEPLADIRRREHISRPPARETERPV